MRMQEKMKEGIDFYALGGEPSWSLDIDFDKFMRFRSLTEIPGVEHAAGQRSKSPGCRCDQRTVRGPKTEC